MRFSTLFFVLVLKTGEKKFYFFFIEQIVSVMKMGQRGCPTVATVGWSLQWGVAHIENASLLHFW
jgi:hypothetical protein